MADKYLDGAGFMKLVNDQNKDLRLVLLFGNEQYYIDNCVKAVKKRYLAPGGEEMDLSVIGNDTNAGFDLLEEYIQMPPWLSTKRVVICKNQSLYGTEFTDHIEDVLGNISESCIVVFCLEKAEKNRKITKFILKNGIACEVNYFPEEMLVKIIRESLNKSGVKISDQDAASLAARCESQMRLISSEVEKIRLYAESTGKTEITFNDLETLCPPDLNASIFTITDCFGSGNCENALKTLNSLLIRKEPVQKLRATLITHLKRLIIAKDLGDKNTIAQEMKFSPYYANNLLRQASRFTLERLFDLYFAAIKSESDLRHGISDERSSLEVLIVKAALK